MRNNIWLGYFALIAFVTLSLVSGQEITTTSTTPTATTTKVEPLSVVFSRQQEFDMKDKNLVTELDVLGPEFLLSFDLLLSSINSDIYQNILHLTTYYYDAGPNMDSIPGLWLYKDQRFMINSAISGQKKKGKYIYPPIQPGKWIHFEISQLLIATKYMFEVKVDEASYWVIENNATATFENIKVFAGLSNSPTAAKIKNLKIQTTTTKTAPSFEISCNDDGSVCYISGTLVPLVTELASDSPETHDVRCCGGVSGQTTTTTCGNGTSCANICGSNNSGCLTVLCDDCHTSSADQQVCDAPMQEKQWCANVKTIRGITNQCETPKMKRSVRTSRAAPGITTMILNINYCPRRCHHKSHLPRMKLCCLHPYVRRHVEGVKRDCCVNHGLCV